MLQTTLSASNPDAIQTRRASRHDPVAVARKGAVPRTLSGRDEYPAPRHPTPKHRSVLAAIATHASEYVEFEPPRLEFAIPRTAFN